MVPHELVVSGEPRSYAVRSYALNYSSSLLLLSDPGCHGSPPPKPTWYLVQRALKD
jgi:hypothetical protein